jgi:succinate dehydrogenase / fumarate reductase iron-sulfur subunit
MKERVVDRTFDPLVWLGNKIGVRNKDNDGGSKPAERALGLPA